jgi:cytochrome c biogenesis protein CcdA
VLILVPIAFAAGVITAFTPCILPVLPIVLAGGAGGGTKRRPYAIAAGLVTTFTAFLLAGAWLWGLLGISAKHQIRIGAVLLLLLALTLVVPKVGELVERPFARFTRRRAGDLGGGFLLGASLGLVFVPCGGPVLAALTANAATDRVGGWIVAIAIAYAVGAALPLLALAHGSRGLAARSRTRSRGQPPRRRSSTASAARPSRPSSRAGSSSPHSSTRCR